MKKLMQLGTVMTAAAMLCACGSVVPSSIPSAEEYAQMEMDRIDNISFEDVRKANKVLDMTNYYENVFVTGHSKDTSGEYDFSVLYTKDGYFLAHDSVDTYSNGDVLYSNIANGAGSFTHNQERHFQIYPVANYNENVDLITYDSTDYKEVVKSKKLIDNNLIFETVFTHTHDYSGKEQKVDVHNKYTVDPDTLMTTAFEFKEYKSGTDELVTDVSYTIEYNKPMEMSQYARDLVFDQSNGVCTINVFDITEGSEYEKERTYKVAKGTKTNFYDAEDLYAAYSDKECTKPFNDDEIDTNADSVAVYIKLK